MILKYPHLEVVLKYYIFGGKYLTMSPQILFLFEKNKMQCRYFFRLPISKLYVANQKLNRFLVPYFLLFLCSPLSAIRIRFFCLFCYFVSYIISNNWAFCHNGCSFLSGLCRRWGHPMLEPTLWLFTSKEKG